MKITVSTNETRTEEKKKAKEEKKKEKAAKKAALAKAEAEVRWGEIINLEPLYVKDIVGATTEDCDEGLVCIYFDPEHQYLKKILDRKDLKSVILTINEVKSLYENGEVIVKGDEKPDYIKLDRKYKFLIENIIMAMIAEPYE